MGNVAFADELIEEIEKIYASESAPEEDEGLGEEEERAEEVIPDGPTHP